MTTTFNKTREAIIVVPIDALLDSRAGAALQLDNKAFIALHENNYQERKTNDLSVFCKTFSSDQYVEQWKGRDKHTLDHSIFTSIVPFLKDIIIHRIETSEMEPIKSKLHVKINTWPYRFEEVEKNTIVSIVEELLDNVIVVTTTYISLARLSPAYIKRKGWDALIMVDFIEWLTVHHVALAEFPIPAVECFAPKLIEDADDLYAKGIELGEISPVIEKIFDPYELCQMALSGVLCLNFIPVEFFSMPRFNFKK